MDEIAAYNQARWKALVEANALFTRPALDLDSGSARLKVDQEGRLGDVSGKSVLCLACGGGQQSAAFALLGANVTVADLSAEQLVRDDEAAAHYGFNIKTVQADMRDLSNFEKASFDIVHHAYSINFVPQVRRVFQQVASILRSGGVYHFYIANPFVMGVGYKSWNGYGYQLTKPYVRDAEISYEDQNWVYDREGCDRIMEPKEFRHTLSDVMNGLIETGFLISQLSDSADMHPDLNADPGSWDHFVAFAPPWLSIWAEFRD
jgi:ubiquinone/menaquinone biosynthesis C-methylase UbiE